MGRLRDLVRFYDLLDRLSQQIGGPRLLAQSTGRHGWPQRGVYFFFEPDEMRRESGTGPRVVRVGTHAVTAVSRTTLWNRLSQHRGNVGSKGGNHRGSVFRKLVGAALQAKAATPAVQSWGHKQDARQAVLSLGLSLETLQAEEHPVEVAVSQYIGRMPFLWVAVPDMSGAGSDRSTIECGAISLLSNWDRPPLDPPSETWLGLLSDRDRVSGSGLWNVQHVGEDHDPAFLQLLEERIHATR
jgi:hypothetical protein